MYSLFCSHFPSVIMGTTPDNAQGSSTTTLSSTEDSVTGAIGSEFIRHSSLYYPVQSTTPEPSRPRRRQVKNACTACQKACKKCDDGRPCKRCILYKVADSCVDSARKERVKGKKRGPYKKRDGTSFTVNLLLNFYPNFKCAYRQNRRECGHT